LSLALAAIWAFNSPLLDHTWNSWKDHWTALFVEMCNINHMTSGNMAFANQTAA
jgi:hypothetical protein